MKFATSDLHLCHDRGFIYEPRGFDSVDAHNEAIVERWNSVVSPEDEVYILGDLMLNDNEKGIEYLNRLNGHKFFVKGNHDSLSRVALYQENGVQYLGSSYELDYKKYHFHLCHYPTLTGNLEKESLKQMMLNLFGHTHSKEKFYEDRPYMYNVALDAHDCYPVSFEQIIQDMNDKVKECKEML